MHLPMSQRTLRGQRYDFSSFRHYYMQFRSKGLRYHPFYWNGMLRRQDVEIFFHMLENYRVVVLGGGNSSLGLARYKAMGELYHGDGDLFRRVLLARQQAGLLTAGFSAGADQLCEYISSAAAYRMRDPFGFGLARQVVTSVHHTSRRSRSLRQAARRIPECLVFGLPNDSALGVHQGHMPSGNFFQVIWFILDYSWAWPRDAVHIRTRMGEKIEHYYHDGRHWAFNDGDMLVRIMAPGGDWQFITLAVNGGHMIDYGTQKPSPYGSIEEVLASH